MHMTLKAIPARYVGEDCLQTSFTYKEAMILLSPDEILFEYAFNPITNKYMLDERRKNFPYSNIPNYVGISGFKKYNVTHQLLNFNTPYLKISKENIESYHAFKTNKSGILISEQLTKSNSPKSLFLSREELEKFFSCEPKKIFIVNNATIKELKIPTLKEILNKKKSEMVSALINQKPSPSLVNLKAYGDNDLNRLFAHLKIKDDNMKNEDIKVNDYNILMIREENGFSINYVDIALVGNEQYKVTLTNVPITSLTLDELKNIITKRNSKPKLFLALNPDIDKNDIKKAKKVVRQLS